MAQKTMIQAITDALDVELANDPKTLVFGEDVGKNGGVFRIVFSIHHWQNQALAVWQLDLP